MDNEGIRRTSLEESLQELLKENDAIRSEIKKLARKHSINHAKIDAIMEELTAQEIEKESFLMKLWRQLLKFLLGKISPKRKPSDSGLGLHHLLSESDQTVSEQGIGGQRPPSLCQPMELEDANLTLSGSVQTINDTEELMKEMTPWKKKIRIIVEDEDGDCEEVLDSSGKKVISPTESFEDEVFPPCRVVLVPSSSFGKDICQDLTVNGVSSTPSDASVQDSPAVFLFGEKEEEEEGSRRKGDLKVEEICRKIPLTLDET